MGKKRKIRGGGRRESKGRVKIERGGRKEREGKEEEKKQKRDSWKIKLKDREKGLKEDEGGRMRIGGNEMTV